MNSLILTLKNNPIYGLSAIALLISVIGFFPLLGLPGGIIYTKWHYILNACGLTHLLPPLEGDKAWPCALLISVLWPWSLPIGALVAKYLAKIEITWSSITSWLIISYIVWSLLVSLIAIRISK